MSTRPWVERIQASQDGAEGEVRIQPGVKGEEETSVEGMVPTGSDGGALCASEADREKEGTPKITCLDVSCRGQA
ncbi:unnamed protein product [Ilex paraguariensis]|uniref:Uncharacterized protein n=1 Tax=Ilex paraguariensis TaxID=185542 RepID=A0ABC8UEA2_9AQUA